MLIYDLLINESWIKSEGKSYIDFEGLFLNSEAVMFRQILRVSNTNDAVVGRNYEISQKLLSSAFKPITFALNHLVFS